MEYTLIGATKGTNGIGHWKANKPKNVKPVIIGTVEEEGVEFYVDEEGKQYRCDAFDKMFGKPVDKTLVPKSKKRSGSKSISKS